MNMTKSIISIPAALLWAAMVLPSQREVATEVSRPSPATKVVEAAEATFKASAEAAAEGLLEEIEEAAAKVRGGDKSAGDKLKTINALQEEKAAFLESPEELPEHPQLLAAVESYSAQLSDAKLACWDVLEKAADSCIKSGDNGGASAILERRAVLLGGFEPKRVAAEASSSRNKRRATPEKAAVQPFVAVNIDALKEHRPRYCKGVPGLWKDLDKAVQAADENDRVDFRQALQSAITRTEKRPARDRGSVNSRDDILLVLKTMRDGKWDLRRVRIHRRDHRDENSKAPELQGLPGVDYDPLASFVVGSRWIAEHSNNAKTRHWKVRERDGRSLVIEHPSIQGRGTVVFELLAQPDCRILVKKAWHDGTRMRIRSRRHKGEGIVGRDFLRFDFNAELKRPDRKAWQDWGPSAVDLRLAGSK